MLIPRILLVLLAGGLALAVRSGLRATRPNEIVSEILSVLTALGALWTGWATRWKLSVNNV